MIDRLINYFIRSLVPNSFVCMFARSVALIIWSKYLLAHLFAIRSCIRFFFLLFVCLVVCLFVCLFVFWLVCLFALLFICLFVCSFIRSLGYRLTLDGFDGHYHEGRRLVIPQTPFKNCTKMTWKE